MAENNTAAMDALEAAWRDVLVQDRPMIDLVGRLLELTDIGAHPVGVDELAAALGRSATETERLIGELAWPWVKAESGNGVARVELVGDSATPRYRYRFGERVIGVDGCAPDAFLTAHALRRPMELEATCPVTGAPIRVQFAVDGTVAADPPSAVVRVIHPQTAAEALSSTDADKRDTEICLEQPLFASLDAARDWLDRHPGGQAFTVGELQQRIKRILG